MTHLGTVLNLRFRYVIGLSVIALLVTTSFITMYRIVSDQRNYSTLVNLAGHQSGLANRICYFASLMAITKDESEFSMAKSQVGRSINKMLKANETLQNGDPKNGIPKISNEKLMVIYEDPMLGLTPAFHNFIESAKKIYDSEKVDFTVKSAPYLFLTTYGPHVLDPLLDAVVDEYEAIAKKAILKIEKFELIVWLAAIFTLLGELIFIFFPLDLHIRRTLNSLEESILQLTNTKKRLLSAQKLAMVGDWQLQLKNRQLTWSDQIYDICGVSKKDFIVTLHSSLQLVHPDDREKVRSSFISLIKNKKSLKMEYRIIRPDRTEGIVFQYAAFNEDGVTGTEVITGTMQDITERKEISKKLEILSEHIPGFIFQFYMDNGGRSWIPYASKGIIETCGLEPDQVYNNSQPMFELLHEEDIELFKCSIQDSGKKLTTWNSQYRIRHPQKGYIWLEVYATPECMFDGGIRWHGYIWDITERKQSEDRIRKLALYDPLTGLTNRRLLKDRLSQAIASSRRTRNFGSVIMLDLDNFKSLNDTKGHEVGDALLIEVASRLNNSVRESDTVSRLGGDEFVVILESLGIEKKLAETRAMEVAEKIRIALSKTYYLGHGDHVHHGSASIGATLFLDYDKSESELLKRADVAMYEAKDLGRNRACFYTKKRQVALNRRNTLVQGLQMAIEKEEFSLYLQPQFSANGLLCGAEALLRWLPLDKNPISPGIFIPIAENTGLIIPIGEWVLERACKYLMDLEKYGMPDDFAIAVNISARQFNDEGFIDKIKEIINRNKVETSRLKIELTESCLVQDMERGRVILSELRHLGLMIELDDFGTGYSSLNSLHKLPITALKIDCSLINGLENDSSTKPIVLATLAMAKAMMLKVVAEGVETPAQREFLIEEGCDMLQGFLYARPMPYDKFVMYLRQYTGKSSSLISENFIEPFPENIAVDYEKLLN